MRTKRFAQVFALVLTLWCGFETECSEMVASWYGQRFHGCLTASGEVFDKEGYTVAHRTLPFGTILLLTNPKSGRFLVAVVNDRGPFRRGRDLDVSERIKRELEMYDIGRLYVEVLQ